MRTLPKIQFKENSYLIKRVRTQNIARKFAIVFILIIQLAIIFKMLI
jgi:hypothetical protein